MSESNDIWLEAMDGFAVSARRVCAITEKAEDQIEREMKLGTFPLPILERGGMKYWRLGNIARLELGLA